MAESYCFRCWLAFITSARVICQTYKVDPTEILKQRFVNITVDLLLRPVIYRSMGIGIGKEIRNIESTISYWSDLMREESILITSPLQRLSQLS